MTTIADYASEVAPELDRLRLGVMRAAVDIGMRTGLVAGSGLDLDTFTIFAVLRNAYPDRAVPVRSYRAAYVYQDPTKFDRALSQMVQAGVVAALVEGRVALTDSGRKLMARVRAISAQAAEDKWGSHALPAFPLADRCLSAAASSAIPHGAFHLVSPPHDQPDDSDAARLAERLTGLRWHRFDAHVAAWTEAGFTAESIGTLEPGPVRDAIEINTNERASAAYVVLSPEEREAMLDSLRRLA